MRTLCSITATLVFILLASSPALAETPAETPQDSTTEQPVRAAALEPSVEARPAAPADAAPVEDAKKEEGGTSGWFRVDTDSLETQFWLGATHSVGSFAIASDIYVVGSFAEFDIGPSFSVGDLTLTPMVGLGFDFSSQDLASLIAPQLFTIFDQDKIYLESWVQVFLNDLFSDGATDSAYTRNFALYKASDELQIGPQVELTYQLNDTMDAAGAVTGAGVTSLPIGARINLGYGANNTLGVFLGYDTKAADGSDGVAGRFTFVRSW